MPVFEWRCGGGGPDGESCDAVFSETGDGSAYRAAMQHAKSSKHRMAGLFRDGALEYAGADGAYVVAQSKGAIRKGAGAAKAKSGATRATEGSTRDDGAGAAADPEGPPPEDEEDEQGDPFGDEDEEEGDGEEREDVGDGGEGDGQPLTPRGRRPSLAGAYRAWVPYPALSLNEIIGVYFRGWCLTNIARADQLEGMPAEFDFARPVADVMSDWLLQCVQDHQREHPDQYDMGSMFEEPRMRALDDRERTLRDKERQVRDLYRRTLEFAATLQAQQAEMIAAGVGASGGGR